MDEGEHKGRADLKQGEYKGGNNKIEIVKGKSEVSEKDRRGRLEWDLILSPICLIVLHL